MIPTQKDMRCIEILSCPRCHSLDQHQTVLRDLLLSGTLDQIPLVFERLSHHVFINLFLFARVPNKVRKRIDVFELFFKLRSKEPNIARIKVIYERFAFIFTVFIRFCTVH